MVIILKIILFLIIYNIYGNCRWCYMSTVYYFIRGEICMVENDLCKSILDRCTMLAASDRKIDAIILRGIRYSGDIGVMRCAMLSDEYKGVMRNIDVLKLPNDKIRNIGLFIHENITGSRFDATSWGRYNAYMTLKLTGKEIHDTQFAIDMLGMKASILTDLLSGYINPVHAINVMYKFNIPATTKGGAISVKSIMSYYGKDDPSKGYTMLRKMLVSRLKTNLDSVYAKYRHFYLHKGKYIVPLSQRDMDAIYAEFIRLLISVGWDSDKVNVLKNNLPIETMKFTSLNHHYNPHQDVNNVTITKMISLRDNTVTLFECGKYSYELVDYYPDDRTFLKFNTYYKRAILTYDEKSDAIFLKILRFSSDIAKAGYADTTNSDIIDIDSHPVQSENTIDNISAYQKEMFDMCYDLITKYKNMGFNECRPRMIFTKELIKALKDTYIIKLYDNISTGEVSLHKYIHRVVEHFADMAANHDDAMFECIVTSIMSLFDCDNCDVTFCEITKDGVILSCGYLHDLWLTYLEEKHKSK